MSVSVGVTPELKERMKGHSTLRRFLVIVVILSIAFPAVMSGTFLIYQNYQRTLELDSKEAAMNYADLLQAGMTMPLWEVAPSLGQPVIDSLRLDPSIVAIEVVDQQGNTFLSYQNPKIDDTFGVIQFQRSIEYQKSIIGELNFTYSLADAQKQASKDSELLLIVIAIQLLFSLACLSYFLNQRVISPLNKLEKAAAGIAGGDLRTAVPQLAGDEFGSLSRQLETMRWSLERSFTHMEDRVAERTAELVELNKELNFTVEQLNATQGNLVQSEKLAALGSLVAGVAHELNTPIGNGLTVASTLNDSSKRVKKMMEEGITKNALQDFLEEAEEGSGLVCKSLERASELVNSFKQVAVDRTSAQRRCFDMLEMLNETRMTLSPTLKKTPYLVEVDCPTDVMLDSYPGPLGQVITNLINNAIVHGFDGREFGTITIVCRKDEAETLRLIVEDDGKGIAEENINRIFDPFFTTKLGEGGNGLGMHILHNIVTGMMGGQVVVESKVNVGTKFTITMPATSPNYDHATDGTGGGFKVNVQ